MAKRYYDSSSVKDSGMIKEAKGSLANLPQNVIMKEYPKARYMNYSSLDDTMRVVDHQMNSDASGPKIKRGAYPEKY